MFVGMGKNILKMGKISLCSLGRQDQRFRRGWLFIFARNELHNRDIFSILVFIYYTSRFNVHKASWNTYTYLARDILIYNSLCQLPIIFPPSWCSSADIHLLLQLGLCGAEWCISYLKLRISRVEVSLRLFTFATFGISPDAVPPCSAPFVAHYVQHLPPK